LSIATRQFGLLPVVLVLLRVDLALLPVNLALLRVNLVLLLVNLALLLVNLVLLRVFLVSVKLVLSCAPENCIYPLAVAARNLAANVGSYTQAGSLPDNLSTRSCLSNLLISFQRATKTRFAGS